MVLSRWPKPTPVLWRPRWRFIAETLKQEILSGHFDINRQLPSDTKVAERFSVSRMTARKALASLQSKGDAFAWNTGRGSFVELRRHGISARWTPHIFEEGAARRFTG
ncbi:GntR family transcriptional regulator [Bradyrhizobium sp. BR 1432]|uniref:GntR family transcriptional regulator n=1 Tax=Bradyrhizobium sp. BR 1432 TaxID=3447966 RepID=UPI003EE7DFB8